MNPSVKNGARAVLHVMQRILPHRIYAAIYGWAFNAYRSRLRAKYYRKVLKARKAGDEAAVRRAELVHAVMPYSLVGHSGLERTYDLAKAAVQRNLAGAFVECGVAEGGCAALIGTIANREGEHRHCWFFDSYEGLPDPTGEDFAGGKTGSHVRPLPRGSCLGTYEQVGRLLFDRFHLSHHDVTLVKGWFQESLPQRVQEIGPVALLRIDADWYESTKCCLENLYDRVVDGGFIIVDDYFTCHGAARATDEFLQSRSVRAAMTPDGRGGCSFEKPAGRRLAK